MPVHDLIQELGKNQIEGSSVDLGVPYQNIPGFPLCHRDKSDWRAERICEIVDVKDKMVLDLGCNVGTMSGVFKKNGAHGVIGIDYDYESLKIGREVHADSVTFVQEEINLDLVPRLPQADIVVWTSQFMWMVKQYGMEHALGFLFELSKKCEVLVFETAGRDDGSAPLDLYQEEILPLLIKNTCFQDIRDYGPWGDGWAPRNVFVCRNPRTKWESEFSTVERTGRSTIVKAYKENSRALELKERELLFLKSFNSMFFPRIIDSGVNWFSMHYEGIPALWIPQKSLDGILFGLKANGVTHRDIKPENILWNGENCVLIDFSYAVHPKDITNHHYNLGGKYKSPYGFDDEFSLRKVQFELMGKL